MQIIYGGKTKACLPKFDKKEGGFPKEFSLSFNLKHYSNEQEALKHLDEVIIPYVTKERERLNNPEQIALLIMDVFKGQMTDAVLTKLHENKILLEKVPANFTYLFQPLDAQGGPNVFSKQFMRKKFTQWYSSEVIRRIHAGQSVDTIDIKFRLTAIKPRHAVWLKELYNYMTSPTGKEIVMKGWTVTGIYRSVQNNFPLLTLLLILILYMMMV